MHLFFFPHFQCVYLLKSWFESVCIIERGYRRTVGRLSHKKGSPDSGENGGSFGEEGRTPERHRAIRRSGGDTQSHREDKEPDSKAPPKPSSLGAAEMNNLDMQGETAHRRIKKLKTL